MPFFIKAIDVHAVAFLLQIIISALYIRIRCIFITSVGAALGLSCIDVHIALLCKVAEQSHIARLMKSCAGAACLLLPHFKQKALHLDQLWPYIVVGPCERGTDQIAAVRHIRM